MRSPCSQCVTNALLLSLFFLSANGGIGKRKPKSSQKMSTSASKRLQTARNILYEDPTKALEILHGMGDADELGGGETFAAIGAAYAVAGEHSKSITYFRRAEMMVKKKDPALTAIAGQSPYALADLNSWGMSLDALDRLDEAADRYEVALQMSPNVHEIHNNIGNVRRKQRRAAEAESFYSKALHSKPNHPLYTYNHAMALRDLGTEPLSRHSVKAVRKKAAAQFRKALEFKPAFYQAHRELADLYNEPSGGGLKQQRRRGLRHMRTALKQLIESGEPARPDYFYALGEIHADIATDENEDHFPMAMAAYWQAIAAEPDSQHDAFYTLLWFMQYTVDWRDRHLYLERMRFHLAAERGARPSIRPLQCFVLLKPEDDLELMRAFAHDITDTSGQLPARPDHFLNLINRRPRVGFASSDFGNHPLGHDFQHFFSLMDRNRFEIYAYNLRTQPDTTRWRKTIVSAVEHWVDISGMRDEKAAATIAAANIDILINLNGYTPGSRSRIFALQPSPIQIMYKGWAGTIGAEYVPYLIADKISVPPEIAATDFSEKVIYTDFSYFLNDYENLHDRLLSLVDGRQHDQGGTPWRQPSEAHALLPDDSSTFIFFNFNQHFKLDPETLTAWLNALRRTNALKSADLSTRLDSVLWLLEFPTATGGRNLRAEAAAAGIPAFSKRTRSGVLLTELLPEATHLTAKSAAHLHLDSFVYNGHTTSADALWAGVPMVTLVGQKMISRTAGGFGVALGCPEMLAASAKEFEDISVALAVSWHQHRHNDNSISERHQPNVHGAKLAQRAPGVTNLTALRSKLVEYGRKDAPFFDTKRFAKGFEGLLSTILESEGARRESWDV